MREVPAGNGPASPVQSRTEQLGALLEAHRGERHIIVLQSFPDPDAISSAFAHQMIAERYGIECDIAYDGRISHHENIALVELMQLHLLDGDLRRYQGSVFIDTQGTTPGLTEWLRSAGSLRTKKATLNPDAFLKEALGGPEAGRYYGGGRREAGGFEIAIGFLVGNYDDEFMEWKWRLCDEQIKRKLWSRLGVEKIRQPHGEQARGHG
ncbi:MAG TPA: hypothetical protein VJ302_30910 [Blastocatellia bacterium]|nr:hypothetical protein [Blastocatellia bacterium]